MIQVIGLDLMIRRFTSYGAAQLSTAIPQKMGGLGRSQCGQPSMPPWRLALVTIMQFREHLADRQAAEAVRARIDWKYLLGLELTDPGFDFSVLSEFRDRLLTGSAEERLLDKLLAWCQTQGLIKARGRQRTDATHVLASIRMLSRIELVAETGPAAEPVWLGGGVGVCHHPCRG